MNIILTEEKFPISIRHGMFATYAQIATERFMRGILSLNNGAEVPMDWYFHGMTKMKRGIFPMPPLISSENLLIDEKEYAPTN